MPDGTITELRVELGLMFPKDPPQLRVMNRDISHEYVDRSSGFMKFQILDQWSYPNSRLVSVVMEAITLLTGRKPDSR